MKKVATMVLLVVLCLGLIIPAGLAEQDNTVDPASITGKVVMADFSWLVEEDKALAAAFNEIYPNIEIEIISMPDDVERNDWLTTQAATQTLPDIIRSPWHDIPVDLAQGWLYPLNDYLDADDEFYQYVAQAQYETFFYNDKIYCLPYTLGFTCMVLNLDMLEEMNEDVPAYDAWTIDEFTRLVKKATTNTNSGLSGVWNFDYFLPAQIDPNLVDGCLNEETGLVDITSGAWVRSVNLVKELKSIPGLIADELWNQTMRDAGEIDEYEKKFGKDADAIMDGKVFIVFNGSTWGYDTYKNLSYNWDYYPLPFDEAVGFRSQAHNDVIMMTATAQDPDAAFLFLKFLSYGKDGNLHRLNLAANATDAEGNPSPSLYIPPTQHPDVVAAFKALDYVPAGVMYMYDNMDKSIHGDHYRYVPNFNQATGSMMGDERQAIYDGEVEAAAVAAEMEAKINEQLKEAAETFYTRLAVVQADFDATHSAE